MSRKRPNMTLHILDEDKDEPMMAGSEEEFDVLEDIELLENEDETNCRYLLQIKKEEEGYTKPVELY
eukprot:Em0001g1563a